MKPSKKEVIQILTYNVIFLTLFVATGLVALALGPPWLFDVYMVLGAVTGLSVFPILEFVQSKGELDMSKYSKRHALKEGSII